MILILRADAGSLISCKLCLSVLMGEDLPWFCDRILLCENTGFICIGAFEPQNLGILLFVS